MPPLLVVLGLCTAIAALRFWCRQVFVSGWRYSRGNGAAKGTLRAHQQATRRTPAANAVPPRSGPEVAILLDGGESINAHEKSGRATLDRVCFVATPAKM